jgi:hypothetical protein
VGMTGEVSLQALGLDPDELRAEVVESAARKLLAGYVDDDKPVGKSTLADELRATFEQELRTAVQPRVTEVLEEAFEAEFVQTDQYGDPKPRAEPMTLREYIVNVVHEHIKLGDNREGYSYGNKGNTLSQWLNVEVAKVVRHELWDKYKQLADAVVDRATATIRRTTS